MKDCILFFVKYPTPGEVKTRLAEDSSPELAAEYYSVFVEEKLSELAEHTDADIIVCHAPESARKEMPDWLGTSYRYIGQKGVGLGMRMENGFREAFFMGYDRVVLVGSDIPALTGDILREALDAISPDTAVIGPADDGGYYLIGFQKGNLVREVFHNMEWSTDLVFQQTASRIEEAGKEFHELPQLEDTDTIEDVETLIALGSMGPLGPKSLAMARKLTGM